MKRWHIWYIKGDNYLSNYSTLFFNKIIEDGNVSEISRLGISKDDFITETDQKTYEFLMNYASINGGKAPSLELVMTEVGSFIASRGVTDSYDFLAKKLLNEKATQQFEKVYMEIPEKFADGQEKMSDLIADLTERLTEIKLRTDVRNVFGTSVKNGADEALSEYQKRKSGETVRSWKSGFKLLGDYVSGNVYVWYGRSGRGKSAISMRECVSMAKQGAKILDWSMEMTTFERLVRYYSYLSADDSLVSHTNAQGKKLVGGFDTNKLRNGKLSAEEEAQFIEYTQSLITNLQGDIIIRGVDDEDFGNRDLSSLESEILNSGADVLLIDPFYYLDYEKNTSKTAGGDAAETSKKLRRLSGKYKVVTFAITQAEEDEKESAGEDREILLPKRSEVKKTKALLEDANQLIAVDTNYHMELGEIGINKGRDGGEGTSEEIKYIPNIGIIEPLADEISYSDFGF